MPQGHRVRQVVHHMDKWILCSSDAVGSTAGAGNQAFEQVHFDTFRKALL